MNKYSPDILEKKLHDHMSSFLSENAWDFNKSLYHYTSYEGLKGILESRRLWQTDFFFIK